jgi:hypothetical protein
MAEMSREAHANRGLHVAVRFAREKLPRLPGNLDDGQRRRHSGSHGAA